MPAAGPFIFKSWSVLIQEGTSAQEVHRKLCLDASLKYSLCTTISTFRTALSGALTVAIFCRRQLGKGGPTHFPWPMLDFHWPVVRTTVLGCCCYS